MNRQVLQILTGLAVAAVFLWLSFRDVGSAEVFGLLSQISYVWVVPYFLVLTLANLARSERWKMVLDDDTGANLPRTDLFAGIMYGYAANMVVPRAGELLRAIVVSRSSGIDTPRLFGTVVLERVIDMLIMLLMIVATFLLLITDPVLLTQLFGVDGARFIQSLTSTTGLALLSGGLLIAAVALYVLRKRASQTRSFTPAEEELIPGAIYDSGSASTNSGAIYETAAASTNSGAIDETAASSTNSGEHVSPPRRPTILNRILDLAKGFLHGLIALRRLRNGPLFVFYTLVIWSAYVAMTYIPFYAFGFHESFDLGWEAAFVITVVSAVGITIPSPGGIGTYHFMVQQGLAILYGVGLTEALAYATISHIVNVTILLLTALAVYLVKRRPKADNNPSNIPF